ncbi:hypothetical protein HYDPIDRAFT_119442 [Hydnomerulius pinastri MD-312]|uniref:Uncharacterized protein n=1 Tax=Hydnomerulius pinastri MD-312 TaxID=994086 RepID=A0A0C9W7R4_9AGAM|nr:hypothetical protein HYDPIDRAFT_119442 [Hydnomerulius pinastri MD-312]
MTLVIPCEVSCGSETRSVARELSVDRPRLSRRPESPEFASDTRQPGSGGPG